MDVKLENLIERIKKEGIEGAQQMSDEIIEKAKGEADSIIDHARKEAEKIVEEGRNQATQFQENAELALRQAARDAELLLRAKFTELFDRVFKKEVSKSLAPDFLKELILKIVDKWSDDVNAEIILSKKDKKQLEDLLFSSLKDELKDSITIKVSSDISRGFRFGLKGEHLYYDFSDESIAEMLKMFLNPRLKQILDKEDG